MADLSRLAIGSLGLVEMESGISKIKMNHGSRMVRRLDRWMGGYSLSGSLARSLILAPIAHIQDYK